MNTRRISASMSFDEASDVFIAMKTAPVVPMVLPGMAVMPGRRARYVSDATLDCYGQYARRLSIFFGPMPLESIEPHHLAEFQRVRLLGEGFTRRKGELVVKSLAGPNKINQELDYLLRLKRMAGCCGGEFEEQYDRFEHQESEFMPALSCEQRETFLEVAASRPEWHVVWWYSLIALHVCFSSDEMRTIRQGDINLTFGILGVNRRFGKNPYRRRDVALTNGECIWALEQLLERAKRLGCAGPDKFLFPFRESRGRFDGTRPMGRTGLRGPFHEVRVKAGVPWFRLNGMRHTGITELAIRGTPIAIIMDRAGHSSPKMTRHYTHITQAVQRMELMRHDGMRPPASVRDLPRLVSSLQVSA